MLAIHPNARTTPAVRAEIAASPHVADQLAIRANLPVVQIVLIGRLLDHVVDQGQFAGGERRLVVLAIGQNLERRPRLLFAQLALGMFGDATETSLTSPSIPFSRHLSPLLGNAI